jgi:DNA (cytosine-5)-methyltransferase 1
MEVKHLGDICKINGAEIEIVDVITGGSPCQDLSIAGKRAGLAGARSGLFVEQVRIVKEMREHDRANGRTGDMVRPRFMVWENVIGAFSSNKGQDFAAVLEEIIRIAEPEAPDIDVSEKGWPTWGGYHDEVGGRWSVAWRVHDAQHWGVPQRRRRISVVADFGGDTAGEILFERKSVSRHPAESGTARERLAGNAENGASYAVRIRGGCDGGGKGALVQEDKSGSLGTSNDQTIFTPTAIGNQVPLAYGIGNGQACEASIMAEEIAQTLNTMHDAQAVMCEDVSHALRAKANCAYREDAETYPVQNMVVRRLTPMECERLQGFPDGWTDIGEWRDSKGKMRKPSDSPRYKALGNSIALPFWDFLAKRISAQYLRPVTMGSLFDGIGGFPLVFERHNGKGTARWASEIEEFPTAVTKLRFGED